MNLDDLNTNSLKVKRFRKVFESRFGHKVDFDTMKPSTAVKMVNKLDESISSIRESKNYHQAEKNPRFAEALMLKEGLDDWLHVKLGIAHKRKLTEGEIESAEAVLAAKDFVDRLQKMLEDVSRIMNEDLPPLSDVIRDQMGVEQADGYADAARGALEGIRGALESGRSELDSAARVLSGDQEAGGAMDMGGDLDLDAEGGDLDMGGEEGDLDLGGEEGGDLDIDLDAEGGDDFGAADAEIGGEEEVGRELR